MEGRWPGERKMKKVSVIVLCLAVLFVSFTAAVPSYSQDGQPDEILRRRIVGKWGEGDAPYGVVGFEEGGVYRRWVYESPKRAILIGQAKGTWWIKDRSLYNTVYETSPNLPPTDPDEVFTDRIFDISDTTLTLIDRNGSKYTRDRVK
jgi:hypothetical protein